MMKFLLPRSSSFDFLVRILWYLANILHLFHRHNTEEPVLRQLRHVRTVQRLPAAIFHKVRYRLKGAQA